MLYTCKLIVMQGHQTKQNKNIVVQIKGAIEPCNSSEKGFSSREQEMLQHCIGETSLQKVFKEKSERT